MALLSCSFNPLNRSDTSIFSNHIDHLNHSHPSDAFDPLKRLDRSHSSNPLDDLDPFAFSKTSFDSKLTSVIDIFARIITKLVNKSGIAPAFHCNMVFN